MTSQERSRAFCGSIKYPLYRLHHERSDNPRQLDQKNVQRLIRVFELEGCDRLNTANHVPALISGSSLTALLDTVPGGVDRLKTTDEEPESVDQPDRLTYLHGRHRLEAAKRVLVASEKWWVIDLYEEDLLSVDGIQSIRNEYLNARSWFDGDVFRHLRRCHLLGDDNGKMKWLSRLSAAKQRDVQILEKRKGVHDRAFAESLDSLIDFTGLWPALQIGTFHRLLSLRCPEEMTRYLHRVWETWNAITLGDTEISMQLDTRTVETLQGRCPAFCEDQDFIESRRSSIFAAVINPQKREELLAQTLSIDYIIPSLHTFLEDTKYLEPCAKIMKRLLPVKFKGTIHQAFEKLHNGQRSLQLQASEVSSHDEEQVSVSVSHWKAYRQLWLFTMRHFPEMIGSFPRKDTTRTHFSKSRTELIWWNGIVELAIASGYSDVQRPFSNLTDADTEMAKDFLRRIRPPSYGFSSLDVDRKAKDIVDLIQGAQSPVDAGPEVTAMRACPGDLAHRCGVPFEKSFEFDRQFLFLAEVYDNNRVQTILTSFAVKRNMFRNFFGTLDHHPARKGMKRPEFVYSISQYSQSSGTATPVPTTQNGSEIASSNPATDLETSPADSLNESLSATPVEHQMQIVRRQTSAESIHSLSNQSVPHTEAERIFWDIQKGPNPDPGQMVILKEQATGMFTIHVVSHENQKEITKMLVDCNVYVKDGPESQRQRLTNLTDIEKRRETCVMVYHPKHEGQIPRHVGQG